MNTVARWSAAWCVSLTLAVVGGGIFAAENAKLDGKWKLVLLPYGEDEFLLMSVETKEGKIKAETVEAQAQVLGNATVKSLDSAGDAVTLVIAGPAGDDTFKGTLAKDGKVLGMYTFRGTPYPARLEKTEAEKLAPLNRLNELQKKLGMLREADPKAKVAKLEELLKEYPGPRLNMIYAQIFQLAEAAGLSEKDVAAHLKTWIADAKPYGPAWEAECRTAALRALQGKKTFASLTLGLAQEADKSLAKDATLEQQASVLTALVSAAKQNDKADLVKATEARLAKIEGQLDEEYHAKVPPFAPETYAGREKKDQTRVVLMELFTGAQCPPCVAADVGFDGLLKTYKTTELVTLQYHLHIPGPDPLTTKDAETRSAYYGVGGTPSTYFNGAQKAGGGGGMANSKSKYDQFRAIIDEELTETSSAKIELKAVRNGDKIVVTGTATALDDEEKKDEKKEPKLRLRLALTEESIRYVGGNRLRFHHHVVRDMPGGPEGIELADGKCKVNETIDLAALRTKLAESTSGKTFAGAVPDPAFKGLAVVAFVQDDEDKRVLHAISLDVPDGK